MATYLRPATLSEALANLDVDARNPPANPLDRLGILAGATDFFPAAAARQAWFQPTPANILDISAIAELRGVTTGPDGVRIGALATWTDVINSALPPAFDALKQASRQVGGVQIQNRGTLAGNLCNASPAADGVPPLLALDAEVELVSAAGSRRLPLADFILSNRRTALRPDELMVAIHVPKPADSERSLFLKLGARAYLVISIASAAVNLACDEAGRITRARIAAGACSAAPQRLPELERRLAGLPIADAAQAVDPGVLAPLSPIDDIRASAGYRLAAVETLLRQAFDALGRPLERAA
ncbi:MAG: FAD binding domain-containing protein [Methylocystis sp.]|nr:FAD binding domain-containing protein [Methylocystis sp.]MCA3585479.1 FAD binding domain-containing protein [Methylocystis sp.]MCA3589873.1 FAD binding domain-containing protein [Methylocystis sp.]MCA3591451.1 FAD binding domain-containing protein [Methylocystis sp.]